MSTVEIETEGMIRLSIFLLLFCLFALLEKRYPRRSWLIDKRVRWLNNLSLTMFNTFMLRMVLPFSGTAFALLVQVKGGLLLDLSKLPHAIGIPLFVIAFDMTIYFQHRLFHWLQVLWVLHRVHHSDLDYDVTTGNRFHPLSILISMMIKLFLVWLVGPPMMAILIAEVLLNATSMFNHSNIALPQGVEKTLRWVIVTPEMHRIHHSSKKSEHSCNFGFNFSCWDRVFGTYLDKASIDQSEMRIGIEGYGEESSVRLDHLLVQPLK